MARDSDSSMASVSSSIAASPYPTSNSLTSTPRHHRTTGSVCPVAAEAWNQLALHVSSQMKFAYEMERLLQAELKKLNLASENGSDLSDELETGVAVAEDSTPPSASPIGATKIPLSMQTCV